MKKPILIARANHETLFIEITAVKGQHTKEIHDFIQKELPSLYPYLNAHIMWDYSIHTISGKKWALVTIIDSTFYTELRIRARNAYFASATSIIICRTDFKTGRIFQTSHETIYYDSEKQQPLSIPQTTQTDVLLDDAFLRSHKKYIPLFAHKAYNNCGMPIQQKKTLPIMLIGALSIAGIILCSYVLTTTKIPSSDAAELRESEHRIIEKTAITLSPPPPALLIAYDISALIALQKGLLITYRFDETQQSEIYIEVQEVQPSEFLQALRNLPYAAEVYTQTVQFVQNIPLLTCTIRLSEYIRENNISSDSDEEYLFTAVNHLYAIPSFSKGTVSFVTNIHGQKAMQFEGSLHKNELDELAVHLLEAQKNLSLHMSDMTIENKDSSATVRIHYCLNKSNTPLTDKSAKVPEERTLTESLRMSEYIAKQQARIPIQNEWENYEQIGKIQQEEGITILYYRSPEGKVVTVEV